MDARVRAECDVHPFYLIVCDLCVFHSPPLSAALEPASGRPGIVASAAQKIGYFSEAMCFVLLLCVCSARSDQYNKDKEQLLMHVMESFRVR